MKPCSHRVSPGETSVNFKTIELQDYEIEKRCWLKPLHHYTVKQEANSETGGSWAVDQ